MCCASEPCVSAAVRYGTRVGHAHAVACECAAPPPQVPSLHWTAPLAQAWWTTMLKLQPWAPCVTPGGCAPLAASVPLARGWWSGAPWAPTAPVVASFRRAPTAVRGCLEVQRGWRYLLARAHVQAAGSEMPVGSGRRCAPGAAALGTRARRGPPTPRRCPAPLGPTVRVVPQPARSAPPGCMALRLP